MNETNPVSNGSSQQLRSAQLRLNCIDGRRTEPIVGAPGGSLGELILLLATIESRTASRLLERQVAAALVAVGDAVGSLGMHTDHVAITALATTLDHDPLLSSLLPSRDRTPATVLEALRQAPLPLQRRLAAYLTKPAFLGCAHLRLLLDRSEAYGIRRGLTETVLRRFFMAWWRHDSGVELDLLDGEHEECGVLTVDGAQDAPIAAWQSVPEGPRYFVHHPRARRMWLDRVLPAVCEAFADAIDCATLRVEAEARLEQVLETTLQHLARDLPRFSISPE